MFLMCFRRVWEFLGLRVDFGFEIPFSEMRVILVDFLPVSHPLTKIQRGVVLPLLVLSAVLV